MIDNFFLSIDNNLVFELFDEKRGEFVELGFLEEEQVCALLDLLLVEFRCQIKDDRAFLHCHKCGNDINLTSSHACANGGVSGARERNKGRTKDASA